jgi:hypothetical protein
MCFLSQAPHLGGLHRTSRVPFRASYFTPGLHPPGATAQGLNAYLYRAKGISSHYIIALRGARTLLDQAHNAIERKLFAMKGFHHPAGSQQAFLTGLAHLYNFIPYQRRAQHAGQCGVEVEGGRVPTADWFLNLQILTSGGFR